jgi:hypothetical protein
LTIYVALPTLLGVYATQHSGGIDHARASREAV